MTNSDNQYVCAMTCLYSKFVYARAVPDKSAQSVCKVLIEMCHLYGPPKELITDQDQEFTLQVSCQTFLSFCGSSNSFIYLIILERTQKQTLTKAKSF